ncbi:GNAT family N-acetyltransferase, partial [Staphylococcus warneri]
MFAKLNQYRQNFQNFNLPLPKPKKAQSQYKFEWVEDLK